jgi:hypothetical protein
MPQYIPASPVTDAVLVLLTTIPFL